MEVRRSGAPHTLKKVSRRQKQVFAERRNRVELSCPAPTRGSGKHIEQICGTDGANYAPQCTCRRRLQNHGVGVGLRQPSLPPMRRK